MNRRSALIAGVLLGTGAMPLSQALAQAGGRARGAATDYPTRSVKLIVPFPPGGTTDILGRLIADELGKQLGQSFVVENLPGDGGGTGSDQAAKAPADGYTLLVSGIGSNAIIHGFASPKPGYTESDFIHISQLSAGPNVLVVHPSFPVKNFQEFLTWVKANPAKFNYAQVTSSSGHLTMEYLRQTAKLDMVGVPYDGGGPALADVVANNKVAGMFTNQDVVKPHVEAGKLRALVVTSPKRNALYFGVPTVMETGYPGFTAMSWAGLSAPKGTPANIVARLETAMATAFSQRETRGRLEANGFEVIVSNSNDYTMFVNRQVEHWRRVIESSGLSAR